MIDPLTRRAMAHDYIDLMQLDGTARDEELARARDENYCPVTGWPTEAQRRLFARSPNRHGGKKFLPRVLAMQGEG